MVPAADRDQLLRVATLTSTRPVLSSSLKPAALPAVHGPSGLFLPNNAPQGNNTNLSKSGDGRVSGVQASNGSAAPDVGASSMPGSGLISQRALPSLGSLQLNPSLRVEALNRPEPGSPFISLLRGAKLMNLPWFRLYAEFGTDPVIQSLAFEDQRHYVILLCLKASGVLDRPISSTSRQRIILRGLGLDPVAGSEVKRRLEEVKLITKSWQICGWDKRQRVGDLSTERVRKHRKSKGTGNGFVTHGNSSGNAPDQDTDTEGGFAPLTPHPNAEFKKQNSLLCTELSANGAETPALNGSGIFMKTCKGGEEWEVPRAKISEWEDSYPDVDVNLTLLGIRQYLRDNVPKRKTARGMVRFLGAWMMREQDKPDPRQYAKTKH